MGINPDLLAIICCPVTRQPLTEMIPVKVEELNRQQGEGRLRFVSSKPVDYVLDGALLREDGLVCYPVREGIPVLLADEGIPLG